MILDPRFEQVLEGSLSQADWERIMRDPALRQALGDHLRMDLLLKVLHEEPAVQEALAEAISASAKTTPPKELSDRILLSTSQLKVERKRSLMFPWLAGTATAMCGLILGLSLWWMNDQTPVARVSKPERPTPKGEPPAAPTQVVKAPTPTPSDDQQPSVAPAPAVMVKSPEPAPTAPVAQTPPPPAMTPPMVPLPPAPVSPPTPDVARMTGTVAEPPVMPSADNVASKSMTSSGKVKSSPPIDLPSTGKVDFRQHVLPILQRSCFECHSEKLKKPKGGIRLDDATAIHEKSRTDNLIFPRKPEKSSLLTSVSRDANDDKLMPPPGEGKPLSKEEVDAIRRWIEQGASFGDWTSEHSTEVQIATKDEAVDPSKPEAVAARIDALVDANLSSHNQHRNEPADDAVYVRRVYLDLIGRIPTKSEAEKYLKDHSQGKRLALIDSLLASPGHVSHMFNWWSSLLRARDELARDVPGTYYLSYIKQSLRDNKPYDQWVRELLSPEGFGWRSPATGYYLRDGENRAANIEATASLFLGAQISCAQCHDHPFDQWTRKDYHQFVAWTSGIVASTEEGALGRIDAKEVDRITERYDRLAKHTFNMDRKDKYTKLSDKVELLSRAAGGSGVVNGDAKPARLPEDYQYDDAKPGETLPAAVLVGPTPDMNGRRAADVFAEWVASSENPRFALTIANRLWAKLFGAPVAGKPDQLLPMADCDNPDLAQYLENVAKATHFDLRQMLRIYCLTQSYQAKASAPPQGDTVFRFAGPIVRRLSAEQVWDSMMTLAVADLDKQINCDPPDMSKLEAAQQATKASELSKLARQMVSDDEKKAKDDARNARKLGNLGSEFSGGGFTRASELPQPTPEGHFLRMFGQGSRDFVNDSWSAPTVPQALLMMNSDFFDRVARSGSPMANAVRDVSSPRDVVRAAFMTVLTREPTKDEVDACIKMLGETHNPKALARTLLTTAEFTFQK